MNDKRFSAMYVFSIGFLVIRALADGETLLEKAGLVLVVLVIAFAMFPLCKRLSELQNSFLIHRLLEANISSS